jgi:hypothetical protein
MTATRPSLLLTTTFLFVAAIVVAFAASPILGIASKVIA